VKLHEQLERQEFHELIHESVEIRQQIGAPAANVILPQLPDWTKKVNLKYGMMVKWVHACIGSRQVPLSVKMQADDVVS
jgi:hypothetical protein